MYTVLPDQSHPAISTPPFLILFTRVVGTALEVELLVDFPEPVFPAFGVGINGNEAPSVGKAIVGASVGIGTASADAKFAFPVVVAALLFGPLDLEPAFAVPFPLPPAAPSPLAFAVPFRFPPLVFPFPFPLPSRPPPPDLAPFVFLAAFAELVAFLTSRFSPLSILISRSSNFSSTLGSIGSAGILDGILVGLVLAFLLMFCLSTTTPPRYASCTRGKMVFAGMLGGIEILGVASGARVLRAGESDAADVEEREERVRERARERVLDELAVELDLCWAAERVRKARRRRGCVSCILARLTSWMSWLDL